MFYITFYDAIFRLIISKFSRKKSKINSNQSFPKISMKLMEQFSKIPKQFQLDSKKKNQNHTNFHMKEIEEKRTSANFIPKN